MAAKLFAFMPSPNQRTATGWGAPDMFTTTSMSATMQRGGRASIGHNSPLCSERTSPPCAAAQCTSPLPSPALPFDATVRPQCLSRSSSVAPTVATMRMTLSRASLASSTESTLSSLLPPSMPPPPTALSSSTSMVEMVRWVHPGAIAAATGVPARDGWNNLAGHVAAAACHKKVFSAAAMAAGCMPNFMSSTSYPCAMTYIPVSSAEETAAVPIYWDGSSSAGSSPGSSSASSAVAFKRS
mmetsp:Transcript_25017/g.62509  ORF Transcript_25017/g.62509 Transcript_25017/m.62509 type:complete len:241 (+) Transcript_25017:1676-2398(+)